MLTKLTLRLDDELIAAAKEYAARTGKPVSRIVADFFAMMQREHETKKDELTPTVLALRGILKGKDLDEKHYRKYLEEKHT